MQAKFFILNMQHYAQDKTGNDFHSFIYSTEYKKIELVKNWL